MVIEYISHQLSFLKRCFYTIHVSFSFKSFFLFAKYVKREREREVERDREGEREKNNKL
jgi:hypothetical protein